MTKTFRSSYEIASDSQDLCIIFDGKVASVDKRTFKKGMIWAFHEKIGDLTGIRSIEVYSATGECVVSLDCSNDLGGYAFVFNVSSYKRYGVYLKVALKSSKSPENKLAVLREISTDLATEEKALSKRISFLESILYEQPIP